MTQAEAVLAIKAKALIITKFMSDAQITTLLVDHTTTDDDDVITYDTTGCTVACLQSIRALVPLMKNVGGVSAMYESIDKTIYGLQPGGCISATRPYQSDVGELVEAEEI